jgi:hypothetical protein
LPLAVLRIDAPGARWAVDIPIFTKEEGQSDLTLTVTMTESGGPFCEVVIDDLHVL